MLVDATNNLFESAGSSSFDYFRYLTRMCFVNITTV